MPPVATPPIDRLRQVSIGFQQAKILLAAAELRLFDRLSRGHTAAELAAGTGADARALEIVLDALVAMGLLWKHDDSYVNDPEIGPLLAEDHPTQFVSMLRHQNRLFRHWAFMEERLFGRPLPAGVDAKPDSQSHEDFIRAMYAASHRQARDVVGRLDLSGVRSVADLGGGPGHYLAAFLERSTDIDGYLVDFARTLDVASRVQAGNAHWSRVALVEWDLFADPAPASLPPVDLAFVSQVVHSESEASNRAFFQRLAPVVRPGGRVVVHENVVDPGRTSPQASAIFAVNMLMMTPGGRTYTQQEIAEWAEAAGFRFARGERLSERSYLIELRRTA